MLKYGIYLVALGLFFSLKTSAVADKPGGADSLKVQRRSVSAVYFPEAAVKDVRFHTEGNVVHIFYTLVGEGNYEISLRLSEDGGKSFPIVPRSLSGAVGTGINPGIDKWIVWDALQDVPNLEGNDFVFEVIVSRPARKWWSWRRFIIGFILGLAPAIVR